MKFAVVGDLHLGKSARGLDRTPEIVETFESIVDEAVEEGCDALIQTGDVFDGSNPTPELAGLSVRLFLEAAKRFSRGVFLIPGNHDLRHGRHRTDALEPLRAAVAATSARVVVPVEPTICQVFDASTRVLGARLLLLPYESKSRRKWENADEYDEICASLVGDHDAPLIVVGHCDVDGAELSSEILSRGGGHLWPEGKGWRHRVKFAIDGHYHKPQTVRVGKWRIECVGTPVVLDFGEESERKRWLVVEV